MILVSVIVMLLFAPFRKILTFPLPIPCTDESPVPITPIVLSSSSKREASFQICGGSPDKNKCSFQIVAVSYVEDGGHAEIRTFYSCNTHIYTGFYIVAVALSLLIFFS